MSTRESEPKGSRRTIPAECFCERGSPSTAISYPLASAAGQAPERQRTQTPNASSNPHPENAARFDLLQPSLAIRANPSLRWRDTLRATPNLEAMRLKLGTGSPRRIFRTAIRMMDSALGWLPAPRARGGNGWADRRPRHASTTARYPQRDGSLARADRDGLPCAGIACADVSMGGRT
jgi:hypothetical protein